MINGQTYKVKSKEEQTKFWLDNTQDYFCLKTQCWTIMKLQREIKSLRNKLNSLLKSLENAIINYED
jgi:hypothetical protein